MPELPPSHHNLSPPPPPEAEPLETSAQNTTLSESSNETYIEEVSETSLDIQREVDLGIQRVQNSIDEDQITFNSLTYRELQQADLVHHCNNPHLYNIEPETAGLSTLQVFPVDISQKEEIERTESPLPVHIERSTEEILVASLTQPEREGISSWQYLPENS